MTSSTSSLNDMIFIFPEVIHVTPELSCLLKSECPKQVKLAIIYNNWYSEITKLERKMMTSVNKYWCQVMQLSVMEFLSSLSKDLASLMLVAFTNPKTLREVLKNPPPSAIENPQKANPE